MISGLINSILDNYIKEKTKVYASHINTPIFKPNEFPDRRADFIRKHNKIAAHALHPFFSSYKAIQLKERKILTMKVLVFMKFLEPYEQYKKQTEEKGKKALKESGYNLQRYNEFMR